MGMYTELIFGASLLEDTPKEVIETLEYMLDNDKPKPESFLFSEGRHSWMFQSGSYYFGVNKAVNKMWFDDISKTHHISIRCNFKNYENEIETFLEWIKPYIESGSGAKEIYAFVIYEEAELPIIYSLKD